MKKLLLVAVTIVAMAGFVNAQSTLCRDLGCECSPDIKTGPGSCDRVQGTGACDSNSLCVNLDNDLANCGKLGRVCKDGDDCTNGTCGHVTVILPSRREPHFHPNFVMRSKHNDITTALKEF